MVLAGAPKAARGACQYEPQSEVPSAGRGGGSRSDADAPADADASSERFLAGSLRCSASLASAALSAAAAAAASASAAAMPTGVIPPGPRHDSATASSARAPRFELYGGVGAGEAMGVAADSDSEKFKSHNMVPISSADGSGRGIVTVGF